MENKNTKQITKKLGVDERYNACPRCGSEVYLYVNEDGEYCVGCVRCDEHNTSTYLTYVPDKDEIDICRKCWNIWATGTVYSSEALDRLNVRNGEYIVTDSIDGYIEFAGNKDAMFDFLAQKAKTDPQGIYVVYNVLCGRLFNIGISPLVDLVLKHYKVER